MRFCVDAGDLRIATQGIYTTTLGGNSAVSGGAFGIEASILTVLIYLVAVAMLAFQLHRNGCALYPAWWSHERARR